jgi:hypothetical protein
MHIGSYPYLLGYILVPPENVPTSFTLTQTSTGNAWTWNSAANEIRDGNWGGDPVLTMTPNIPSGFYTAVNPGYWTALLASPGTVGSNYVRHSNFNMVEGPHFTSHNFAWAFFLKIGTNDQVKIWNPYPSNGIGSWVQSGVNTGRVGITTTNPDSSHIYTISKPITITTSVIKTRVYKQ